MSIDSTLTTFVSVLTIHLHTRKRELIGMESKQTYEIPAFNLSELNKRLEKLNKRAAKINAAPVEIVVESKKTITDPRVDREYLGHMGLPIPQIEVVEISLKGEAPKLGDWEFIGALDHVSIPGSVIIKAVPGQSVPIQYREHSGNCEHCQKIRNRKDTFIVRDNHKNYKAVGRQCLRDFLGHDPAKIVGALQGFFDLLNELNDGEISRAGGGVGYLYPLVEILSVSASIIRVLGWTSRTVAKEHDNMTATADRVHFYLNPPRGNIHLKKEWKELIAKCPVTDADNQNAIDAELWANTLGDDPENDYTFNVKQIAEYGYVTGSTFGLAVSIVSSYLRHVEKLESRKKQNENAEPCPSGRVEIVGEIIKKSGYENDWGYRTTVTIRDDRGFLVWGTCNRGDVGERVKLRATVTPSDNDDKFGFYKRPTNVEIIETKAA